MNKACYICKSTTFQLVDGVVSDIPGLKIFKCENCNLIFLENFDHIDKDYYQNGEMNEDNREGVDSKCKNLEYWCKSTHEDDHRRFEFLKDELLEKDILDFGSGAGGFLSLAKDVANSASGIEPNKNISDFYKSKKLSHYSKIEDLNSKSEFDIITAFHVIEHLKDPVLYLLKIKKLLKKGGSMYLEFPNADDALISYYKNESFSHFTFWSCHLMLFNYKNIETIARKAGLSVVQNLQVQRYPISNHLYWLAKGKPGGQNIFTEFNCDRLNREYLNILAKNKMCDTILVEMKEL